MADGILIVNKEQGFTSFDVVAVIRRVFGQKKVGHGGTLDPMAEGVLPVFLGSATKLCDIQGNTDKTYEAGILLGRKTDTDDIWGTVLSEKSVSVSEEEIRQAVRSFRGEIMQIPPMYSAKKINGKKLYELARSGVTVERKSAAVTIHDIQLKEVDLPNISIRVSCSKGTYIRALARDIGEKLGTYAVMSSLTRTVHGRFSISDAHTLGEIREAKEKGTLEELLLPVDRMFSMYDAVRTREEADQLLLNGNRIPLTLFSDAAIAENNALYRVYLSDGRFAALYRYAADTQDFFVEKMFLPGNS